MYTIMGYLKSFHTKEVIYMCHVCLFLVIKVNIKDISASLIFLISVSTLIYNEI